MSGGTSNSALGRGPALLIAHCAALGDVEHLHVVDRLRQLIGPDLTRLLLVALAGEHRMRPR